MTQEQHPRNNQTTEVDERSPANAVAHGSGYVTVAQMVKGGLWLNVIGIVLITATVYLLAVPVFNIML